jgi:hypothetical protein
VFVMAESSKKRKYRQRVTCSECAKNFDSDYADQHGKNHPGKKVKFIAVHDKSQQQLNSFIKQKQTSVSLSESNLDRPAAPIPSSLPVYAMDTSTITTVVSSELSGEVDRDDARESSISALMSICLRVRRKYS